MNLTRNCLTDTTVPSTVYSDTVVEKNLLFLYFLRFLKNPLNDKQNVIQDPDFVIIVLIK